MNIDEKVAALRKRMDKEGIDAYLINGTDPHNSEYVCTRWETRAFISGFTGSAGTVLITMKKAILWVDSRYHLQGEKQINGTCFTLVKEGIEDNPSPLDYIAASLEKGTKLGVSSDTLMIGAKEKMQEKCPNIEVVATEDYLNEIWSDRSPIPCEKVEEMGVELTGFSRAQKLNMIRIYLGEKQVEYQFIGSLDDIAWVLSLRGDDVKYNSLFMAYLFVTHEKAYLFTNKDRFDEELLKEVEKDVEIYPYEDAPSIIPTLIQENTKVMLNKDKVNSLFISSFKNCEIVNEVEVTTLLKSCKNDTEMEGERRAHLLDGVAMVNFLSKIDFDNCKLNEFDITVLLEEQRRRSEELVQLSFNTIAGFADNGAIVHYAVKKETAKAISGSGLMVLDSGGCYTCGTTDITRTLLFGEATAEQKQDYTLVLKGHIALASQTFPEHTKGYQLDILAKQFMWKYGMTFYHGTGHGVGHRLCVHEGPQRISVAPIEQDLKKGMVVSDEPGLYKEGRHGIRIENLIAVQEYNKTEFGKFFEFETLTLCPYEKKLIDITLLSGDELNYINSYHQWVREELMNLVDDSSVEYLVGATTPLTK
ncbi:MAG: aminopeptidase P family protein [Spirochaetaceae bacterium]|nr:aminopeptidase P family protein [Spirochaetaceae bacterium]